MGDSTKTDNAGSKTVVVSSTSHHEKLISGLWNYFLTNHAVDFEIQWNGRSVRTHRMLLDLFLSTDKLLETAAAQQMIQQHHPTSNNLDSLMEFMYKGTVTISEEQLANVQDIAKQSEFKILVDALEIAAKRVNAKNAKANNRTAKRNKRKIKCIQKLVTYSDDEVEFEQANFEEAPATAKRQLRSSTMAKPATSKTVNNAESDGDNSLPADFEPGSDDVEYDEPYRPTRHKEASDFKMLTCHQCTYSTHRKELLLAHLKSGHTSNPRSSKKPKTYRCKQCPFKTISLHCLRVHNSTHDPTIIVYKCQWCPKKFLESEKLAKHKCMRLGGANVPKCPHCDFRSSDQRKFGLHVARHDPNKKILRCKCDRKFADEESMNRHRCKWKNPDAKPFQCPHCPFTNKLRSQLGYHIKGMHSATKPFKCEEPGCSYACSLKVMMSTHVKVVHQGQKPFVCDKCAYSTYTQSRLNKHLLVHTDVRPYKCDVCERTFRHMVTLKDHAKTHTGEDERPHVCHMCGTAFRRRDTLRTHIRCVHKTQLPTTGRSTANVVRRTMQNEQRPVNVVAPPVQSAPPLCHNPSAAAAAAAVRQFQQPPMPMPMPTNVDLGFSRPKVPNQMDVPYPTAARNYFWNLN